jgi:radical SAM protein with 4Fe4S-binding SPASM domain
MNGLLTVNIELTSRCNKNCWMCGRRKIDRDFPEISMNYGDMEFTLLEKIALQLPNDIIVQFHNNGCPLLYPRLKDALKLFECKIRCLDTNGKLLIEKRDQIEGNIESITISTFQDDPEWEEQYGILMRYLSSKQGNRPKVVIRVLGDVGEKRLQLYKDTGCLIAYRVLHSPMGSFNYEKKTVVPEHGFCLEMISHPAINRFGEVSTCVRFDPNRELVIGDLNKQSFTEIWNGKKRKELLSKHINGNRNEIPFCSKCEFYGIPRG